MIATPEGIQNVKRFIENETLYYLIKDSETKDASPFVVPIQVDGEYVPVLHFWSTPERLMAAGAGTSPSSVAAPVKTIQMIRFLASMEPPWIVIHDAPELADSPADTVKYGFYPEDFAAAAVSISGQADASAS